MGLSLNLVLRCISEAAYELDAEMHAPHRGQRAEADGAPGVVPVGEGSGLELCMNLFDEEPNSTRTEVEDARGTLPQLESECISPSEAMLNHLRCTGDNGQKRTVHLGSFQSAKAAALAHDRAAGETLNPRLCSS